MKGATAMHTLWRSGPSFVIINPEGNTMFRCKHLDDAVRLVSLLNGGSGENFAEVLELISHTTEVWHVDVGSE